MPKPPKQNLAIMATRLRELRTIRGWKLHQVADKVGIDRPTTYANYEYGYRTPSVDTLRRFAAVYNVTVDYLTGNTDDPKKTVLYDEKKLFAELTNPDVLKRYTLTVDGKELTLPEAVDVIAFIRAKRGTVDMVLLDRVK